MAGGSEDRSLQETPTWAVAIVCGVFVIISIIIEHGIHSLGKVRLSYVRGRLVHGDGELS